MAQVVGAPAAAMEEEAAVEAQVSFPDLVRLHLARQRALEGGDSAAAEADARYQRALKAFEAEHGRIVNAYWCSELPSAVALTERRRAFLGRFRRPAFRFHRVSDWATKERPELAGLLHECDELGVKVTEVLRGKSLRIGSELVMTSAGHVMSLADIPRAAHERKESVEQALALQHRELARTRAYYRAAANGEAQIVYALGMVLGAMALAVGAALLATLATIPGVDNRGFFGSLAAGAVGAVVSVISRVTSGRFRLGFEVGRDDLLFLGAIRPLLGALFGLALYFAVISGVLDVFELPPSGTTKEFYFLLVIAFLAGFSERWAQDMLFAGDREERRPAEPEAEEPAPEKEVAPAR